MTQQKFNSMLLKQFLPLLCLTLCGLRCGLFVPKTLEQRIYDRSQEGVVILYAYRGEEGMSYKASGFVVAEGGIIATNFHAIVLAESVIVKTSDGELFRVEGIVAENRKRDVVLLKITTSGLDVLPLGKSDTLKPGQQVFAIGTPGIRDTLQISSGVITNMRNLREGTDDIEMTAPISVGSSGGPLLDVNGTVIGMTVGGYQNQHRNYAIPITSTKQLLTTRSRAPKSFSHREWLTQPEGLFMLGLQARAEENYRHATELFALALRLRPNYPDANFQLGYIYSKIGQQQAAVEHLQQVIALQPNHGLAYANLGTAYLNLGEHRNAITAFTQALRITPDWEGEVYFNLGQAYLHIGDAAHAYQQYQALSKVDKQLADALLRLLER
jgi:Flp pilus assembly protein TadD